MPIPAREARPDTFLDRVIATAFRATACILNGPRRYVHRVPTQLAVPRVRVGRNEGCPGWGSYVTTRAAGCAAT
jgi:hypothetical protein